MNDREEYIGKCDRCGATRRMATQSPTCCLWGGCNGTARLFMIVPAQKRHKKRSRLTQAP